MGGIFRNLLPDVKRGPVEAIAQSMVGASSRERNPVMRDTWKSGVNIMLSSDAGTRYTFFDEFHLSVRCAVELIGVSPREALVACTSAAAKALGLDKELGTLAPGKQADIIAMPGNPLENIKALGRVDLVILGGKVVVRNGQLPAPVTSPPAPPTS
jgi:imidazolonepropionase-like amidohydrolase